MVAGRVQFYSMLNLNNFMMIQEVELFVHVLHQGQDKSSNNTNTPLKISGMKYSCLNYTELKYLFHKIYEFEKCLFRVLKSKVMTLSIISLTQSNNVKCPFPDKYEIRK